MLYSFINSFSNTIYSINREGTGYCCVENPRKILEKWSRKLLLALKASAAVDDSRLRRSRSENLQSEENGKINLVG